MTLKLWYAPGTCATASLIALEEAGAAYEAVRLDFAKGEQRGEAFVQVNPKGRVPALDTGRGILTETPAILTFIGQSFPGAGLLPAEILGFARLQEFMSFLASTVHVSHAHRVRGTRWADDPAVVEGLKAKVAQNMSDHFAYLEDRFGGPWVLGEAYSVADPYLFVLAGWLKGDGVDIASFPKIAGHSARMREKPAVARALQAAG
ncbi:MAG: glutathione S-transferase family protein [Paracoccaceae bacterium]